MDGEDVKRDAITLCHWYEESPCVISSNRIFTAIILVFAGLICIAIVGYLAICLFRTPHEKPDPSVLGTLAGALTALAANVAANVATRNKGV